MTVLRRPTVTADDNGIRPAGPPDACFYCHQKVGQKHKEDCVLTRKPVRVRVTIEYTVQVPQTWDADAVLLHRNGSSWCADNLIDELIADREWHDSTDGSCLCGRVVFDVQDESGVWHKGEQP